MWGPYLDHLRDSGRFEGGSSIGSGNRMCEDQVMPVPPSDDLVGFLLIAAEDHDEARRLVLAGNPTHDAGGIIELRELLVD